MNLKSIPNIGNTYIEYVSAIAYLICKNRREFELILKDDDITGIVKYIDYEISLIRQKEKSDILFINVDFIMIANKENYVMLKQIMEEIKELIVVLKEESASIADGFEYIITNAAQNSELTSKNGRFYTPKQVIKTMVEILDIKKNGVIYNPACSTGNFLVESMKYIKSRIPEEEKINDGMYAFGEEENLSNYNICMTNLYLNNISNKKISESAFDEIPKADYVIANPPFDLGKEYNEKIGQQMYINNRIIPKTSTYVKFIIRMLENADERGKIATILPQGFLFKGNIVEKDLRRELIERQYIDAIIRLPEKLFFDTSIPVIILIMNKARMNKDVLFIDASEEYSRKRKTNILTEENTQKIVKTYRRREEIQNYSYIATVEEIRKNNYNLNINNYIKIKEEKQIIDIESKQTRVYELEKKRNNIQTKLEELLEEIKKESK